MKAVSRWLAGIVSVTLLCSGSGCMDARQNSAGADDVLARLLADMAECERRYSEMTVSVLSNVPDSELERAIVCHADSKIGNNYGREVQILRGLPPGVGRFVAASRLEVEVFNGGFNQFFANDRGPLAPWAAEAYRLIGAVELAEVVGSAIETYREEEPRHQEVRAKGSLQAFSESYAWTRLNDLDDRFYAIESSLPLSELKVQYIRANPREFASR